MFIENYNRKYGFQDYLRVSTSNDGSMVARALVTEENVHMAQVSYS